MRRFLGLIALSALAVYAFWAYPEGQGSTGFFVRIAPSITQIHTVPAVDSDVFTLNDATQTLTNKTIDGAANVITNVTAAPAPLWRASGRCHVIIPISEWSADDTDNPTPTCVVGTNTRYMTLVYDDAATYFAQDLVSLPANWGGSLDVDIVWTTPEVTGSVVWQVATACVGDAETLDPAFNAADTVTDGADASPDVRLVATIAGANVTGCSPGDSLFIQLLRDPTEVADDLGGDAAFIGMVVHLAP